MEQLLPATILTWPKQRGTLTAFSMSTSFIPECGHFHGRAAEVGPGDLSGVGLKLLGEGCFHVDLVDRFRIKVQSRRTGCGEQG